MTECDNTSKAGNEIVRSHISDFTGDYSIKFRDLLHVLGYMTVYAEYDFNWVMANPENLTYYTYCEGDVTRIICKDVSAFLRESHEIYLFLTSYNTSLLNEFNDNWALIKERIPIGR